MSAGLAERSPRPLLGRVIEDLGSTLLSLSYGDAADEREVSGLAIWDPEDDLEVPVGSIVLGVGIRSERSIVEVIRRIGPHGVTALVIRAPIPASPAIAEASRRGHVSVLGLTQGASWAQLAAMLRSIIAGQEVGIDRLGSFGSPPSDDLFALANAITALLDAPVTIEDRNSRLLAFSERQEDTDPQRIQAILGRQVPKEVTRAFIEKGVFRDIYRSRTPVMLDPERLGLDQLPRVVMAVRASDEVLGSIWVAVRQPLTAARTSALVEASNVVALHLLRARARADVERRVRSDLLSDSLNGGVRSGDALSALGLAGSPFVPFAVQVLSGAEHLGNVSSDTSLESERLTIADALGVHLLSVHPRSVAALVGPVVYGLLPTTLTGSSAEARAVAIARDFIDRIGQRVRILIGVGPAATSPAELANSRTIADRVLRVLLSQTDRPNRAATMAEVHFESLIHDLRDLFAARGDGLSAPLAALLEHDAEHGSDLVKTLQAWLDAFGDTSSASKILSVHPNTLRYRLNRIAAIAGTSFSDPNSRLAVMVELKMLGAPTP